ncbi:MAG TPA: M13 family metallopeptidase [Acidobacteriaceae bacterium]|nr:M13 family metallopeptidase [Acidobacteriaceae bacterium]
MTYPSRLALAVLLAAFTLLPGTLAHGQQPAAPAPASAPTAQSPDKPLPGLDPSSMDLGADPCKDFYQYACGNFAANHPIPPDQPDVDAFYVLFNVNTAELNGILQKAEAGGATRSPDEQKIGDYFKACMDTTAIDAAGLKPIKPDLDRIAALKDTPASRASLAGLIGDLQRDGIEVFFGYGEQQDFKDASKQIAFIQQGGLGLPEKDYYLRTGDKDVEIRHQYTDHVAKMLVLAGDSATQAQHDADAILALETSLAKASLGVVDMREPEKTYHLVPTTTVEAALPHFNFTAYEDGIHSPHVTEINNATPDFLPEVAQQLQTADIATIQAYLKYHLLTSVARNLPHQFDDENFAFYGTVLNGQPQQRPRWKRCSTAVDGALGEALGKVYVQQYFAGDSKEKMLQMVHDIEAAMGRDIDQIDWMSAPTKARAHEKLAAVANKIGYPDKWRDYTKLIVKPGDALGNQFRADAFENDRELNKIGKPVDRGEWEMSPPTVNAYYDDSMNNINFPAGILQPPFNDPRQDIAVNYGHIGAVIGHELTHGFDDEGRKFDAKGDLDNWWTPEDLKNFTARTDCLVKEYSGFTAVDDVHVNGQLTLGENTADNGGVLLAFMAYMQRAKETGQDPSAKIGNFTGPQRFYIGYAQNWCANERPQAIRSQVLSDPHSPDRIRVDGVVVNQPGFAAAFGCKTGTPMVPANSCRVW